MAIKSEAPKVESQISENVNIETPFLANLILILLPFITSIS